MYRIRLNSRAIVETTRVKKVEVQKSLSCGSVFALIVLITRVTLVTLNCLRGQSNHLWLAEIAMPVVFQIGSVVTVGPMFSVCCCCERTFLS
jgi:hypothetical protein